MSVPSTIEDMMDLVEVVKYSAIVCTITMLNYYE